MAFYLFVPSFKEKITFKKSFHILKIIRSSLHQSYLWREKNEDDHDHDNDDVLVDDYQWKKSPQAKISAEWTQNGLKSKKVDGS